MTGIDYVCVHSDQDKEEEKGMPTVVIKDARSKNGVRESGITIGS